jgi:hypothetical protein
LVTINIEVNEMATPTDITVTPLSGQNYIDALLDKGPDWNFLTLNGNPINTIAYTFSIQSGTEAGQSGQEAFTAIQQNAARSAFSYISQLTGIQFVETAVGTSAQIHLCNVDLQGSNVTGLCSWHSSYGTDANGKFSFDADAYVYLDNVEWLAQNRNLTPGTNGYETLLHELGHALGLKHPFDTDSDNPTTLPASQDNTNYTLMSYTDAGGAHSTYSPYDIAALNWLYGGDGLRGALGINTGGRYLTGTAANDRFESFGGNDLFDGGNGTDNVVFHGLRSNYTFTNLPNGDLSVASKDGIDGVDTLHSIEILQFTDMNLSRASLVDTTPPAQPTLVVTKNANGYATGNTPLVTGRAEVGSTVKIYTIGNQLVGTATADANGLWNAKLSAYADGMNYQVYATATDAAGNVSTASVTANFNVDATPPVAPTYTMSIAAGANQAHFAGTAEASSTIELVRSGDLQTIARTSVGADGKWQLDTSPLPNGSYTVGVSSLDKVNRTDAANKASFTVNNPNNVTGTSGADIIKHTATGNGAIDGGAGIDMVVYAGSRSNFTVAQEAWGFGVSAGTSSHDALINVERVQFDDGWLALDVDGSAGQIFRLYSAAFGRPAEAFGQGYWMWRMDDGTTLQTVAKEFMSNQPEFDKMYGINPTDEVFITQLYQNVLHRAPDADGFQYWLNALGHNSNPNKVEVRAQVLIDFADSIENVALVAENVKHGLDYLPYHL